MIHTTPFGSKILQAEKNKKKTEYPLTWAKGGFCNILGYRIGLGFVQQYIWMCTDIIGYNWILLFLRVNWTVSLRVQDGSNPSRAYNHHLHLKRSNNLFPLFVSFSHSRKTRNRSLTSLKRNKNFNFLEKYLNRKVAPRARFPWENFGFLKSRLRPKRGEGKGKNFSELCRFAWEPPDPPTTVFLAINAIKTSWVEPFNGPKNTNWLYQFSNLKLFFLHVSNKNEKGIREEGFPVWPSIMFLIIGNGSFLSLLLLFFLFFVKGLKIRHTRVININKEW